MNPFLFGAAERPLYGVYHPPRSGGPARPGAVLCYPFGWEYLRSHRAFRQLAARLADAGFHVLRFDYTGTGDSAGQGWEASVGHWLEDIGTAVDELKDTAAVQAVTLVGMRLGAMLAAYAAAERRDIDGLVLWDPVPGGAEYLADLVDTHRRLGSELDVSAELAGAAGAMDVGGHALSAKACEELGAMSLLELPELRVGSALVVAPESSAHCRQLAQALEAKGIDARLRWLPPAMNGAVADEFMNTVLPTDAIDAMVGHLAGADRG